MCLYPRFIKNRKYTPNQKNGGVPPTPRDERVLYVPIGCGKCIECKTQKAREWQVRLNEEFKNNHKCYFVTLTFKNEYLNNINRILKKDECNATAGYAIRRFLERWRKKYKKSVKHWLITELGHNNTERIHIHGIIWCNEEQIKDLEKIWKYGNVYIGNYCNEKTINYIIKYVTKIDNDHKNYEPQIFCSSGIGSNYINTTNAEMSKYNGKQTREYYVLNNGTKVNLPIYYRNKIYSETEREELWLNKLDKKEIFVRGLKIKLKDNNDYNTYLKILAKQQEINEKLGYGNTNFEWKKKEYNTRLKDINKKELEKIDI